MATALWLGLLLLAFRVLESSFGRFPYANVINGNLVTLAVAIGLVVFLSVYRGWQPLKPLPLPSVSVAATIGADWSSTSDCRSSLFW
jgi:hypothetical protein